jgi:hypothetical protein
MVMMMFDSEHILGRIFCKIELSILADGQLLLKESEW